MAQIGDRPILSEHARRRCGLFGSGKQQVSLGVEVADIFHELAHKILFVRQFPTGNVLAEDVAQNAPKVFMARISMKEHESVTIPIKRESSPAFDSALICAVIPSL